MSGHPLSNSGSTHGRFCVLPRGVSRRRMLGAGGVSRLVIAMLISGQVLASGPVTAAELIGEVERVKATSYGTPPGAPRAAKQLNDPLVFKELLETLSFSALEASLLDGSVLTLGASARVVLDEFVYDASAGGAGAILDMAEGSLRFVSGNIPKEAFRVNTPVCTIAIRGTNFKVRVRPNGDTLVAVDDGAVVVGVTGTGEEVVVNEGQSVEILQTGTTAVVDFTDDEVLLVGNQIVDFGWGDESTDDSGVDQAQEAGETYILPSVTIKRETNSRGDRKNNDGGSDGGGEGGGGY